MYRKVALTRLQNYFEKMTLYKLVLNPISLPQIRWDTRSIFKWAKAGLNQFFSFETGWSNIEYRT